MIDQLETATRAYLAQELKRRTAQRDDSVKALRSLYRAYVSLLETGRELIVMRGGTCDSVDVMEKGDPALREARQAMEAGAR